MLLLLFSYTRSVWVKYYLAERNQYGEFHRLVGELRLNNGEDFKEYFRVSRCQFDEIVLVRGSKESTPSFGDVFVRQNA